MSQNGSGVIQESTKIDLCRFSSPHTLHLVARQLIIASRVIGIRQAQHLPKIRAGTCLPANCSTLSYTSEGEVCLQVGSISLDPSDPS